MDPANPWRQQRARRTLLLSGVLLVAGGFAIALIDIYLAAEDIIRSWIGSAPI